MNKNVFSVTLKRILRKITWGEAVGESSEINLLKLKVNNFRRLNNEFLSN
ncbi:hypothetical protein AMI01nite_44320 [Aneurinibacillus migulanus]|nr:hypothetical protein AMI01nite_44320 [Aneurinibacillus migulanus]